MYHGAILRVCGAATAALVLTSSVSSQTQQKSAKELIAGKWTLMIADNIPREGNSNVPGFGPLPNGHATFGPDGRYSFEVMPSTGSHTGVSASGTYALDEAGKALTLKVEESSIANWKGTTQTGAIKFVSSDHLGWTTSAPLVVSADFTGTELIWARSK
jgi:hypothetical protein